ncbi:hypothetical protein Tco_0217551 [Tanacetum coccineum]
MACSLPHIDSEVEALVQRLINEDKGRQDVLLSLAFQFKDSCAVRDDLRKAYEKCNDISQESRVLICTLLKESSEKDRKLHLSMEEGKREEGRERKRGGGKSCGKRRRGCEGVEREWEKGGGGGGGNGGKERGGARGRGRWKGGGWGKDGGDEEGKDLGRGCMNPYG